MKPNTDIIDRTNSTDEGRRGIFRRSRRTSNALPNADLLDTSFSGSDYDTSEVDDIARRMSQLSDPVIATEEDLQSKMEAQKAEIARANQTASSVISTPEAKHTVPVPSQNDEPDIQARMNAVLAPVTHATQAPVMPTASPQQVLPPQRSSAKEASSAMELLGIDAERVIRIIEEEARTVQQRIELEIRSANTQAADIVSRAEAEAERVREHGQNQARVLLGEVEEIISEAQATGEQILLRANEESKSLRADATSVLHQAQAEARAIVETARREGEQVLAEQRRLATVRAQEAMREQDRLKDQIRRLEERRRQVLESLEPLISQLTQMMPTQQSLAPTNKGNVVQLDRSRSNI